VYWQIKAKVRESISKALDKAEESLMIGEMIAAEKKRVLTTVCDKMRLVDNLKRKSETFEMASQEVINLNREESYSHTAINLYRYRMMTRYYLAEKVYEPLLRTQERTNADGSGS
jgi:hypothetical protein